MTFLIALGILLSSSSSAAAVATAEASSAPTLAAAPQAKKAKKPKKICKADPRVTGTRIAKRICKTQEEWDEGVDTQEVEARTN